MEKKEKIQLGVTVIGVIVLIVILAGSFGKKPKKGGTLKPAPGSSAAPKSKNQPDISLQQTAEAIAADSGTIGLQKNRENIPWGRDPFSASKISREYQRADLELKGISFGADKSGFAFINNEIVKSGDKVGDYEVVTVEKDKILLKRGSQSFYLALPKE